MSRARRFHVPELGSGSATLSPEEAHHALKVLRLGVGDAVELFDGRGRAVGGTITLADEGSVSVTLGEELDSTESPLDLTVALAVPKPDRMAFAVQKLTELGTRRIAPLSTARSLEAGRKSGELERWRRIVLEATKQCGRSRLAEVTPRRPLAEVLKESRESRARVLMAEPGSAPLRSVELAVGTSVVVLIGPEGGWTEEEIELGRGHEVWFFGMGPRVLRTETAAVATAALLQARLGDG